MSCVVLLFFFSRSFSSFCSFIFLSFNASFGIISFSAVFFSLVLPSSFFLPCLLFPVLSCLPCAYPFVLSFSFLAVSLSFLLHFSFVPSLLPSCCLSFFLSSVFLVFFVFLLCIYFRLLFLFFSSFFLFFFVSFFLLSFCFSFLISFSLRFFISSLPFFFCLSFPCFFLSFSFPSSLLPLPFVLLLFLFVPLFCFVVFLLRL